MDYSKLFAAAILRIAARLEKKCAYAQGKGYGAGTIRVENKLVHELLKKAPLLAVDIGGNVGEYSAELRQRNPDLEIHVFEPSSVNVDKLMRRFSGDQRLHVLPYALSDRTDSAVLYSNVAGSGLGSLTQRRLDHFGIDFDVKETVRTIRFEDYWRNSLGCRILDVVKIDIEGHELAALKGFGDAIGSSRIVQFEFGGCNIDTRTYFQDFWYYFKDRKFVLYRITPNGLQKVERYTEADEFFSTTNYLAVNTGL